MIIKYIDSKGYVYVRDVVSARIEDNIIYIDMYGAMNGLKVTCPDITTCLEITNNLYYDGRSDLSSMENITVEEIDYESALQDYLDEHEGEPDFDISYFLEDYDDYDDPEELD